MENLIGEILDRGDGVAPILGVGLAPRMIHAEDREGDEEADDGDDKEDEGDVHGGLLSFTDRGSVPRREPW